MEIFNIGPLELILFLLIMFFLLGPKGMIQTAQKIGLWIRKIVKSPVWQEIMGYSQDIRELPKKLMDDTGLKEALDDVQQTTKATAAELNATVNEAVQSARVPEAEHVKIDTTSAAKKPEAPALSAKESQSIDAGSRKSYPVLPGAEVQRIASPEMTSQPENKPASPDVEVGHAPVESQAAEVAQDEPADTLKTAVEAKKPRRRNTPKPEETNPGQKQIDEDEKPVSQKRRNLKVKKEEISTTSVESAPVIETSIPTPDLTSGEESSIARNLEEKNTPVSRGEQETVPTRQRVRKPRTKPKTTGNGSQPENASDGITQVEKSSAAETAD